MSSTSPPALPEPPIEADSRFPSGEWTGFFLQPGIQGRCWMELILTFRDGSIRGEGRDWVGEFIIRGRYHLQDGTCYWHKSYPGKHMVAYKGYNEGRGIWGTWEMYDPWRGGFRIWPVAMGDPTLERLREEADEPIEVPVMEEEPVGAGVS